MLLTLDRKEQRAFIAIAQIAHDDLSLQAITTDDADEQSLCQVQIIDIALLIEAVEADHADHVEVKMSNDLIFVLGLTAKQHLITWNDDHTEILDKAGGSWYSVSSKLERKMKEALTIPELS
jgi:hypothetical protein